MSEVKWPSVLDRYLFRRDVLKLAGSGLGTEGDILCVHERHVNPAGKSPGGSRRVGYFRRDFQNPPV